MRVGITQHEIGEPDGLLRRVEPEKVRLGFMRAHDRVVRRHRNESPEYDEKPEQRNDRGIAHTPHAPLRATPPDERLSGMGESSTLQ